MTKTRNDLCKRALRVGRVTDADQEPSAPEYANALETYESLLDELSEAQGMVFDWPEDEIPESYFQALAAMTAGRMFMYDTGNVGMGSLEVIQRLQFPDDRVPGTSTPGDYF